MCGIVGTVGWGDRALVAWMRDLLEYRGPDDQGIWETTTPNGTWVGLGSRRLAIQDLSPAGHMPMTTEDGRFTVVYNGEIYNYPQLREELQALGYRFRSTSDTESLLYLYQEFGPEMACRLNGIFAIAIWDHHRQELFLARDHFGIKPLYYTHQNGRLAFASEAKALLRLPDLPRRLNYQALQQYFTFLWIPDPLTMFEGIYKLPAGHYALLQGDQLTVTQYWDLRYPPSDHHFAGDEAELTRELRRRFVSTVQSQLISDVPVGAFLSAGLDSTSIVAAMVKASGRGVRTYTVAFPERYRRGEITLDDTEVARRSAEYYGCEHTECIVEPDVAELLPQLVWHMDEPTADPALIAAYLVNREARKDVTVLLSGVGGDELFAGYRKYQAHYLAQRYQHIPRAVRAGVIEPMIESLPSFRGTPLKGYVRLAKKMVRSGSLPAQDRFIRDSIYLTDEQHRGLFTRETCSAINGSDPLQRHRDYFAQVATADPLNQMLYVDTKAFMVSLNLNYNDKMSMATSVEVRVPFLDWQLAEWVAWNVPPHLKLQGKTTKHIFREAMRPLLPPEVLRQKKAGFGAPLDYWLAHDLRELVDDLLGPETIRRRGFFNPDSVRALIDEHRTGRQDWSLQIWQFLTFELWLRAFLD